MKTIKFSHKYKKLYMSNGRIPEQVKLLQVIPFNLENAHPDFISYDTDNGRYSLPKKGEYLILLFRKDDIGIFTTIRRSTPEKLKYYTAAQGEIFKLVIEDSK